MAKKSNDKESQSTPPVWEWILAAIGLVLVGAAIGTAFYRAIAQEDTPPRIEVAIISIKPAGSSYLVEFEVRNTGTKTAGALNIEAQLTKGGEPVETSMATLAYSPSNSVRRGGLFFTKDPNTFELKIRALGFESP